jgi:uncharacterized membrane protein (UPF0127 family)
MKAFNIRNGKQLADNVTVADDLFKRMKGLLGRDNLLDGEALWIKPCMSIHTFFMKYPIDIFFLDKRKRIITTIRNMQPNRLTWIYPNAVSVLELPAGVLQTTDTRIGDEIEIA